MLMLIAFACQQHRELPDWLDLTAAWGRLVYQPWGPLHTASLQLKQCGHTKGRAPFPQKKLRSVEAQDLKVDTPLSLPRLWPCFLICCLVVSLLPQTLLQLNFPVLCTADVLQVISKGDSLTTINIKDIYFHVHVAPHHKPGIPVLAAPFLALTGSPGLYQVHCGTTDISAQQGHLYSPLLR